jgi:hypothetical protein
VVRFLAGLTWLAVSDLGRNPQHRKPAVIMKRVDC